MAWLNPDGINRMLEHKTINSMPTPDVLIVPS
jgi:hypothetical protein